MKFRKLTLLLLGLSLFSTAFAKQKEQPLDETLEIIATDIISRCEAREIVAILDFNSTSEKMSLYISNQLISNITENSRLQIVTRTHMDKIEKELKFQSSGLVSDSTALSIGERLGAHFIVFGTLSELDNKYQLQVNMLTVSSGSYALFKTYTISRSSKSEQLLGRAANYCKASIGVTLEANKNSIQYISPAFGLYSDYNITRKLALGLKGIASYDAFEKENTIYSFEPLGFIRFYLVSPSGEPSTGLFIQGEAGVDIICANDNVHTVFEGGGCIGFRKEFDLFYIEPEMRFGYPYLFGAGITAGLRF